MNPLILASLLPLIGAAESDQQSVVVVVGASGAPEFDDVFEQSAARWEEAAREGAARFVRIGSDDDTEISDKTRLLSCLKEESANSAEPLWLVFVGHGTFDGRQAKFNLRGPDVTGDELTEWLAPFQRPLAIVNGASASGPFINRLSSKNRVVVTGTKSGYEHNFARFGEYVSAAILDGAADLDKDDQTSLLEAYLAAAAKVKEFYEQEARLATEHALLDDNGDGRGTPADWFRGVRATRTAKDDALPDGALANQFCLVRSSRERTIPPEVRVRRDALELEIVRLRQSKDSLSEEDYYGQLEKVLLELARLYEQLDQEPDEDPKPMASEVESDSSSDDAP